MSKQYKIVVPKAGAADESGTTSRLYEANEVFEAKSDWDENLMQVFMSNGWAIELKTVSPSENADMGEAKITITAKKAPAKKKAPKKAETEE